MKRQNTSRGFVYVMKRYGNAYLLMAPYLLLFFIFTILPVIVSMVYSFTYYNGFMESSWVGLKNYIKLFIQDGVFQIALRNTLIFAAITGPLSYLLCFIFAWLINELNAKLRAVVTLVFYAPSISGQVYLIWQLLFSGDMYGYINAFLMDLGLISEPVQWLTDKSTIMGVLIIVQLWLSLGTSFLAFIAGLKGVDRSLYEAAAVDGIRNRLQEVWHITLPCMKPILMLGAVLQITSAFSVGQISISMVGMPSTDYAGHTIITHLLDYATLRFDIGYASSIAVVLFVMMVGTNKLVQRLLRKVGQ